jgi:hypothetical protein
MRGIINLDECVINALELFVNKSIPSLDIKFKKPIVIGSGNALSTGRILFSDRDSVFADESDYIKKLKLKKFDGCVIISASGGKHSPIIAKHIKKMGIKSLLLTNNESAKAAKYADKTIIFPKNVEPYTYNTSTYIGMILGKTKENTKKILNNLKKIKVPNLKKYKSFYIIIPEEYSLLKEIFQTKFDELFGSEIQGRVFTYEQTKHAKTIVDSGKELFIGLGVDNKIFGNKKLNIAVPKNFNYAGFLAMGYYIIGKIQKQNKPYFKKNIDSYVKNISKVFGEEIKVLS